MRFVIAALLLAALSLPAAAQIGLYTAPDGGNDNCSAINLYQRSEVYIVVTGEWSGARFFIPQYDCIVADVPFAIEPLNGTIISGNFEQGFELTFPDCTPGPPFALARLNVFAMGPVCCEAMLTPHPSSLSGGIDLIDCEGHTAAATWSARVHAWEYYDPCWEVVPSFSPPPRAPFPPNGAINVPSTLTLSWVVDDPYGNCSDISGRWANVYFGTSPDPPKFAIMVQSMELAVGPLQPATTYYWKAFVQNYGAQVTGPVWSFTTAGLVATQPTTWGRVKALYRRE